MTVPVTPTQWTPVTPSKWTDPAAIASYITSLVAGLVSILSILHPGFTEPAIVEALVAPIAAVVAGGVQVFNIVTHRSVTKSIIAK